MQREIGSETIIATDEKAIGRMSQRSAATFNRLRTYVEAAPPQRRNSESFQNAFAKALGMNVSFGTVKALQVPCYLAAITCREFVVSVQEPPGCLAPESTLRRVAAMPPAGVRFVTGPQPDQFSF